MLYLHFSALFLSLGQNLSWRAGGVLLLLLCLAVAWDAEGEQPVPYQFSASRGGREGGGSLAKPFATALAELGENLGLSSACSASNSRLYLGNFGAKSCFLSSPTPPRLIFELIFERVHAPRRDPRSRFFKTWYHAHPNH